MKWSFDNKGKSLTARCGRWLAGFLALMAVLTVVSRGAYGVTLPRVQTQKPEKGYVNRSIQGSGTVEANREESLRVPAGLWVQTVYVREGSLVQAGDPLFQLDMKELEASIGALELEKTRLELSLSDNTQQQAQAEAQRERNISRAEEDYASAEAAADRAVEQAAADLDAAKQALEEARNGSVVSSSMDWDPDGDAAYQALLLVKEEKEQALASAEAEEQALRIKKEQELEAARKEAEADEIPAVPSESDPAVDAEERIAAIELEYEELLSAAASRTAACREEAEAAKQSLADYEEKQQQILSDTAETEEALKADYEAKKRAYEEALQAREECKKSGERGVEDARTPLTPDSSVQVTQLELDVKENELQRLRELKEQGGQICTPVNAMIGTVYVAAGQQTPDSSSILFASTGEDGLLRVTVSEAEAETVSVGDLAALSSDNGSKNSQELPVESKAPLADGSGWELCFRIPAKSFSLGSYVNVNISQKNGPYDCCIPLTAVRIDGSQSFVLVLDERETSLGTEYVAVRRDITLQAKNGEKAALQGGSLSGEEKVIVSSTKTIEAGDKVRPEEA